MKKVALIAFFLLVSRFAVLVSEEIAISLQSYNIEWDNGVPVIESMLDVEPFSYLFDIVEMLHKKGIICTKIIEFPDYIAAADNCAWLFFASDGELVMKIELSEKAYRGILKRSGQ